MQAVPDLIAVSAEADVFERTSAHVTVYPIRENALVSPTKLSGTCQHTATVDEDGEVEGFTVFKRKRLRGELGCAVERNRCLGAEGFVDAGRGQAGRKACVSGRLKSVGDRFDVQVCRTKSGG